MGDESSDVNTKLILLQTKLDETVTALKHKDSELEETKLKLKNKEETFEMLLKQKDERINQMGDMIESSKNYTMLKQLQIDLAAAEETIIRLKKAGAATRKSVMPGVRERISMINPQTRNILSEINKQMNTSQPPESTSGSKVMDERYSAEKEDDESIKASLNEKIMSLMKTLENEENLRFEAVALYESAERKNEELIKSQSNLKKQLQSRDKEQEDMLREIEKLKESEKELEISLEKEKLKNKQVTDQLDYHAESNQKHEDLIAELAYLNNKIAQMNNETESVNKQNLIFKRDLETKIEEIRDENEKLKEEKESLIKQVENIKLNLSKRRESFSKKEINLKTELGAAITGYEDRVQQLEQELARSQLTLNSLKAFPNPSTAQEIDNSFEMQGLDMADLNQLEDDGNIDQFGDDRIPTSPGDPDVDLSPLEVANNKYQKALDEIDRKNSELKSLRSELIEIKEKGSGEANNEVESLKMTIKHLTEELELLKKTTASEKEMAEKRIDEMQDKFCSQKEKFYDDIDNCQTKIDTLLESNKILKIKNEAYEKMILKFKEQEGS